MTNAGSYEDEVKPVRGDLFLDKLFGWLSLVLALVVLGTAIARLFKPDDLQWLESVRIVLIVLGIAGCWLATLSTVKAFRTVIALYFIRTVGAFAIYPWVGGPRYFGSEILFDLVVIGYALIRIKALKKAL